MDRLLIDGAVYGAARPSLEALMGLDMLLHRVALFWEPRRPDGSLINNGVLNWRAACWPEEKSHYTTNTQIVGFHEGYPLRRPVMHDPSDSPRVLVCPRCYDVKVVTR